LGGEIIRQRDGDQTAFGVVRPHVVDASEPAAEHVARRAFHQPRAPVGARIHQHAHAPIRSPNHNHGDRADGECLEISRLRNLGLMAHEDPDRPGEYGIHLDAKQIWIGENLTGDLVVFLRPADSPQHVGNTGRVGVTDTLPGSSVHPRTRRADEIPSKRTSVAFHYRRATPTWEGAFGARRCTLDCGGAWWEEPSERKKEAYPSP